MNVRISRIPAVMLLGTLLSVGSAAAQQAQLVELPDGTMLAPWNMNVDAAEDLDVVGANGQKIGEVEEVLGSDPSTPTALAIDFEDNAGFGDRDDVVVPLDRFTVAPGGVTLTATAAEIAAMPVWND